MLTSWCVLEERLHLHSEHMWHASLAYKPRNEAFANLPARLSQDCLSFRTARCFPMLLLQADWGDARYRMTLLLPPREALLRSWADTDSLFNCIADWGAQPIGLRHPFCFYYGHCAGFTKLKLLPRVRSRRWPAGRLHAGWPSRPSAVLWKARWR
jgi:hypothetical protein